MRRGVKLPQFAALQPRRVLGGILHPTQNYLRKENCAAAPMVPAALTYPHKQEWSGPDNRRPHVLTPRHVQAREQHSKCGLGRVQEVA